MKNAFTQEVNQLLVKLGLHPNAADPARPPRNHRDYPADSLAGGSVLPLRDRGRDRAHYPKHTKAKWDDVLLHPQVLRKLTYLIPVLIVYMLLPLALSDKAEILGWLRKLCIIYGIVVVLVFINIFLKVLFGIFRNQEAFRDKPLKGLVQIMQVGLVCIGIT